MKLVKKIFFVIDEIIDENFFLQCYNSRLFSSDTKQNSKKKIS